MTRNRFWLSLPLCLLVALLAAFLFVSPVLAQDEVPPEVVPTEAPAEAVPAEAAPEAAVPTEEAPVEEPLVEPTEAAPADELPVEEAPAEEPSLAEALDDAGVVLSDQSGEPVTLAARSSGMLVTEGDPYFTVGSTTYQFFYAADPGTCGTNCFLSPTPISAALQHMADNNFTPTDRKLYIEAATYTDLVQVDGAAPGVKGLLGIVGLGATPEDVQINGRFYIYNFLTGFSVSNLSVTNSIADDAAIWTWGNKGTLKLTDVNAQATSEDGSGIIISHNGTVELERVNASNNAYHGAYIENFGTGPVKINNSTFDNNLQDVFDGVENIDCFNWDEFGNCIEWDPNYNGLNIGWAAGPVVITGVTASGNYGDGTGVYAYNSAVTVKNSAFDNNIPEEGSDADGSWGDGLYIDSNTVILENIQANNNDLRGIMSYANTSFTGKHLHADANQWSGVQVTTCFEWDYTDETCDNTGAGTVTITNSGVSGNGENGFFIEAKGAVTMTSIYTGGNYWDGIFVDNTASPAAPAVTLTDVGATGNSHGINLQIKGVATLKDLELYDNGANGLHIQSLGTGAITITNAANTFNDSRNNGGNGYFIESHGPVTVTNFDTHENGGLGGYIDNSMAATAAAVTINMLATTDYINGYWNNGDGGLQVFSRGAVSISRVQISSNGGFGAEIMNVPPSPAAGVPVTVSDSSFDWNGFGYDGLNILSKGLITLLNVRANHNGGNGVYLDNKTTNGTAGVTINAGTGNGNEFQGNRLSGLVIHTNGPAALTNLYSANNGYNTYESLGDFAIKTYLSFTPDTNFQFSGLVIYQDKDNFLQLGRAYCDDLTYCAGIGNGIYFDAVVNGGNDGSNFATSIGSNSEVHLRLERSGSTLNGYYSSDGITWTFLGSHAIDPGFQINGIGLTASQDSYNSEPQIASDFDYFGIENMSWVDGFDGYLEDGWVWVNENPEYWNLTDTFGYLRIYNNNGQTGSQNMLLRTVGSGYGGSSMPKARSPSSRLAAGECRMPGRKGTSSRTIPTVGLSVLTRMAR